MSKNYYLHLVILQCLLFISFYADAQVRFKVELLSDNVTYQVSMRPEKDYSGAFSVTNSAQVTLVAPTGGFEVDNFQAITGSWNTPSQSVNPIPSLNRDYFIVLMPSGLTNLTYVSGVSIPLFSFTNKGNCTGTVELMEDSTDPFFNNSLNINAGNQITILGYKFDTNLDNAFVGAYDIGSADCSGGSSTCDLTVSSVFSINESSCDAADGSIQITATGGTAPLQYSIDGGVTWGNAATYTGLAGGSYEVKVRNTDLACDATYSANPVVIESYAVNLLLVIDQPTCGTTTGGTITIGTDSNETNLQYSVDNGTTYQTASAFSGLASGSYLVKIKELGSNCEFAAADNPIIIEDYLLNIVPTLNQPTCSTATDGSISIGTNSNTTDIEYSIDNGVTYQVSPSFMDLGNGTYTIKIKEGSSNCETAYANNPVQFGATNNCDDPGTPTTDNCVITYTLEESAGVFTVNLLSDTTWTGTNSIVASAQITLRAPTGQLAVGTITNATTAEFALTGQQINPTNTPGYDYFSFSLSNFGATLPFTKGISTPLFSFTNDSLCAAGVVQLIGAGDGINVTEVNGANIASQMTVSGFGGADVPLCVSSTLITLVDICAKDTDNDGVPDMDEDLNGNGNIEDDDTDEDNIPNYKDEDDDGDNILTSIEEGAPNNGDGNGDGIRDCLQDDVASNIDPLGDYRTLEVKNTATPPAIFFYNTVEESVQFESDDGYDYPHLLDAFVINSTGTVEIRILYHDLTDFTNLKYRKYGPLNPGDANYVWYDFPHTFSTTTINGLTVGVVTLSLTDNQLGDSDTQIGRIVDPGGLALATSNPTCDVEYILTENNGAYDVSMLSNVTYTAALSTIASMQVTVRAPTGLMTISNTEVTDTYASTSFNVSSVVNPTETPGYDYISFNLGEAFTNDINFTAGQTVPLFTFKSTGTCSSTDSLYLVGEGAPFAIPIIANNGVASQLSTAGGGVDQPVCVNGTGVKVICEDNTNTPPVTSTCDVEYIITENNGVYEVSMLSNVTYTAALSTIASMQITLRAPTGMLTVANSDITDTYASTSFNVSSVINPTETPGYDYLSFNLGEAFTNDIAFTAGQTVPLFTFKSTGTCSSTDSLYLVGTGAPFAIPVIANNGVASQLSTAGGGVDQPVCVNGTGVKVICDENSNTPPVTSTCDVEYILTENNGVYEVSMLSNVTYSAALSTIASMQVTVRAPTGRLTVANSDITDTYASTSFNVSSVINPTETPGYDYLSFNLGEAFTNDIAFTAGQTVPLFTFKSTGNCTSTDSLYLVGTGALFPIPIIANNGVASQLSTAGGGVDQPVCVNGTGVKVICEGDAPTNCEVQYILSESNGLYQVSMYSDVSWDAFERTISTMQITVRAPTGVLQVDNDCIVEEFTGTNFSVTSPIVNPSQTPGYDYYSFTLSPFGTNVIPFAAGQTVPLFTFKNMGTCTSSDSLYLVGNGGSFPIPSIPANNLESQLFAAGGGGSDTPVCVSSEGVKITCHSTGENTLPNGCEIRYILEENNGIYEMKMYSDVSWNTIERTISSMQITLRAPTGILQLHNDSIYETYAGTVFEVTSSIIDPAETPGYDYFSFNLTSFGTNLIPFQAGETVSLFTFKNTGNCTSTDSLYLVGNGASFNTPTIPAFNLNSQLFAAGGGGIDSPVCVDASAVKIACKAEDACQITYILEEAAGEYTVSMHSNVSWNTFERTISTMQVTLRAPTGLVMIDNNSILENYAGTTFEITSPVVNPSETPGYDYFSFTLSPFGTTAIPFDAGATVPLFTFKNSGDCSTVLTDSLYLVGEGAPFSVPIIANNNVASQLSAAGGGVDMPICVSTAGAKLTCDETDATPPPCPTLSINATSTNPTDCDRQDGQIVINVTPSDNIIFSIDGGGTWSNSPMFSNLNASNYTIEVALADTTCNVVWGTITLTEPTPPAITGVVLTQPATCNGTGSIQINSSPASNVIYSVDDGQTWSTTNLFSSLGSGNFNITIANQDTTCIVKGNAETLSGPSSPLIQTETVLQPDGCGVNNGLIQIATIPASGLIYSIDGGLTWSPNSIFPNLGEGTYNISVATADEICVTTGSTVIFSSPVSPTISSVTPTNPTTCGGTNGQLQIVTVPATGLIYSTDGGTTWGADALITGLSEGFYDIRVANADTTCTVVGSSVNLTGPTAVLITDIASTNPTNCEVANGEIQISANPSVGVIYSIDGGTTWSATATFTGLAADFYNIRVANADTTCMVIGASVNLAAPTSPLITNISPTNPTACGGSNGQLQINTSPSTGLIYSINGGTTWQSSATFAGLSQGQYTISVAKQDTTCMTTGVTTTLTDPPGAIITNVVVTDPTNCDGSNGQIQISTFGGSGLIYSIDGGVTWGPNSLFTNLTPNSYTISVANGGGSCIITGNSVTINPPSAKIISTINTVDPSAANANDGSIEIITSCEGAFEYSIDGGATWQSSNVFPNLPNGQYVVRVQCMDLTCSEDAEEPAVLDSSNSNGTNNGNGNTNTNSCAVILTPVPNATLCESTVLPISIKVNAPIASQTITGGSATNVVVTAADSTLRFNATLDGLVTFYTVTITTTTGCELIEEFILHQAQDTEADFVIIEPYCKEAEVTLRFTGNATPNAVLTWDLDGGTLITPSQMTGTAPANSEMIVRWDTEGPKLIGLNVNENGCTDDHIESVFIRKLPLVTTIPDTSICLGQCVNLQGDGTGVWYTWSPAEGLSDPDIPNPIACPTTTTTYTLTVMSADGCIQTEEVVVRVEEVVITASANPNLCLGESIEIRATGGTIYNWSPTTGLSDPTIANPIANPTETTNYLVTVTNDAGCSAESSVEVTVLPLPTVIISENVEICRGASTQLLVNTHASYAWSPATGLSSTTVAAPTANPTTTTTYTVTVTDGSGCTATDQVTVSVLQDAPIATAQPGETICTGETVQLSAAGGGTYQWSPTTNLINATSATPTVSPTATTTYTVVVTDAKGCTDEASVIVTVEDIVVNAGEDDSICTGEMSQLNATGGDTYVWSPVAGLSNPNIANPTARPTMTTDYCVTVTRADGCSNTDCVRVTLDEACTPPNCNVDAGQAVIICEGESTSLQASGSNTYFWSPSTGLSNPNSANTTATPTVTTTYTVTGTSIAGCISTDEVTVSVAPKPVIVTYKEKVICEGDSVRLLVNKHDTYAWNNTNTMLYSDTEAPLVFPAQTTVYTVTVTSGNGCTNTENITVTVDANCGGTPPITCQVSGGSNVTICQGTSTQLNGTGANTYLWTPSTGLNNPNIANPTASPATTTIYTVTGTDAQGCVSSAIVTVTVDPCTPTCQVSGGANVTICQGTSTQLNGIGASTYIWTPSTGLNNPNIANPTASPATTTTYTVTGTTAQGCVSSAIVTITVDPCAPTCQVSGGANVSVCQGLSTQLNAVGANTYTWTPTTGLNNPNISNPLASPGTTTTYTVTGTTAEGCVSSAIVTVTVDVTCTPPPSCQVSGGSNVSICQGTSTQLTATGSNTYTWTPSTGLSNPNISNPVASPSATTTYTVTGTNTQGCVSSAVVTVTVGTEQPIAVACEDKTICRGDNIRLVVNNHSAYSWSPTASLTDANTGAPLATPTVTTTYTVTVTNAEGCTSTDQVTVFVEEATANFAGSDVTICQGGSIQLNATGGGPYTWRPTTGLSNPNIANPVASPTSSITYTVTNGNLGGCSNSDDVVVFVANSAPIANAGNDVAVCPGGSIQLLARGGVSYAWSPITGLNNPNISNPTASPTAGTVYTVTVTDANGCTDIDDVNVMLSLSITTNITVTDASCCGIGGGGFFINASGGFGNLTYSWSSANISGHTASNLNAGGYTVTISDAQGCSTVENINIGRNCSACTPIFTEEKTCIDPTKDTAEVCLPIYGAALNDYIITIDGVQVNPTHGCNFKDITSYSYALVPNLNTRGSFRVDGWELNGVVYTKEVMTISDLTNWMNTLDPMGFWVLENEKFSLTGGISSSTYGDMKLVDLSDWNEATLQPNTTGVSTGILLEIDMRDGKDHQIKVEHPATCCIDELTVSYCSEGQPCLDDMIAADLLELTVTDCESTASFCIEIPTSEIGNYTITDNGLPYTNDLIDCDFASNINGTLLNLRQGYHELIFENGANGCQDRLLVDVTCPINLVLDTLIFVGDEGILCLSDLLDTSKIVSATQNCLIGGSEVLAIEDIGNFCWKYTGLMQGTDQFCLEICTEDGVCRNITQIVKVEEPAPINLVLDTLIFVGDEGILCLSDLIDTSKIISATQNCLIGGSEILAIEAIGDFCWKYTGLMPGMERFCIEVCTEDGVCRNIIQVVQVEEPAPLPCPDFITATALSELLTDCHEAATFCIDIPFDSIRQYGMMLDGAPFRAPLAPCAEGTMVSIEMGRHELLVIHLESDCRDSITFKVECETTSTEVSTTIEPVETDIYCPESEELTGPIVTIKNICPEESGDAVGFEVDEEEFCVHYMGLEEGSGTACLVICDANEVCDTIFLTVNVVLPDPLLPDAVSDTDSTQENTPLTVEVMGNDSINGTLRSVDMLTYPERGEAEMNVDNSITFIPEKDYCEINNPEQFLYRLCNQDGCDTAFITIRIPCLDFDIKNGFSPNGDGVNDVFYIQGLQRFPNNELKVYNRWGNLIFAQRGYKNQWAGTFEERVLPEGTYFYLLDLGEGEEPFSGFVQIQR